MSRRRVVVTGLGLVSPVGIGVEPSWQSLVAGRSGIGPITLFDASTYPTRIAGEVKGFEPGDFMDRKEARRNDRFIQFALAAAEMAMKDSGLDLSKEDPEQIGCIVGAGMGGLGTIEENRTLLTERGLKRISPFFIPSLIINLAPGQISIRYGLKGPNFSTVSACATANHSIGDALLYIERGLADVMVAGGCEATITPAGRGRLLRGAGHVGAERRAGEGQPAVRQGARRLRGRGGLGHPHPRGVRARPEARRPDLRRAGRLRRLGRRLPHHLAGAGGRGRPAGHEDGPQVRRGER